MLRVISVVPAPAAIFAGEKVAVAPVGRPEAANVIAGSEVPVVGLTTSEYTAVPPADTLDGVLPLTVMVKDGAIGTVAASTVTNIVADAGLVLPDPCGLVPVALGYCAVMLYVPTARDVIESVATPAESRGAVPITAEPFMKLTVPVGEAVPVSDTVAVKTSA
jgi:hypothetical protein